MRKRLAIGLEQTNTTASNWVWGDELLAISLASELAAWYEVKLISLEEAARTKPSTYDIYLAFHPQLPAGLGKTNLLWVQNARESFWAELSEEDWIKVYLRKICARYNAVLCSGAILCAHLCQLNLQGPVERFDMFCTEPGGLPEADVSPSVPDVIYVGNNIKSAEATREFLLPGVAAALRRGCTVGIYGAGWNSQELPRGVCRGPVPAAIVPELYRRARVVLNYHFESHRRLGILTSRIFDTLMTGSRTVSDTVEGIRPEDFPWVAFGHNSEAYAQAVALALQSQPQMPTELLTSMRSLHSPRSRAAQLRTLLTRLSGPAFPVSGLATGDD